MANMVNPAVLSLAAATNVKDSRWLTLEVCREYQRSKCTRTDTECKFAHPPPHVEVQNGRVTACFDSIKGKCQRKEPPCKYLHPPQHLREQLLQNGRNNLILRNLQVQAAQQAALNQSLVSGGLIPIMFEAGSNNKTMALPAPTVLQGSPYPTQILGHPYLSGAPTPTSAVAFNPYLNTTNMPTIAAVNGAPQMNGDSTSIMSQHPPGVIPTVNPATAKLQRPDRLEPQVVEVLTGKKRPRDPSEDLVLSQIPGMMGQYKRLAVPDAKGLPTVYQPISNISYQQALMQMQPQQYLPVSFAGHPPSVQRF